MKNKRGVTLIELIMFIVIAAVCFLPVIMMFGEVVQKNVQPEFMSVAVSLSESQVDVLTGLGYEGVIAQYPAHSSNWINFAAPFTAYSYMVEWHYVNAANLDSSVDPTVTDYINLKLTVRRARMSDIITTTALTNYTN